jgi:dCTP deaminase
VTVLSDTQILQGLVEGQIICRPLRIENIRGASIDLTLGEFFWRCDADPSGVFNPYAKSEVDRYFAGPFVAKPYSAVYEKLADTGLHSCNWPTPVGKEFWVQKTNGIDAHFERSGSPFENIPDDWPVLVLRPGERILAHTHEFVGIRPPRWVPGDTSKAKWARDSRWLVGGTSQIHARSTSGRVGIKVCDDAGLGDPGYFDRWTLEMRNDNKEAIVIPLGERVAQINFFQTGPTREAYGAEKLYESKYQSGDDVEKMIEEWTPGDMLPRGYKDRRVALGDLSAEAYEGVIAAYLAGEERAHNAEIKRLNIEGARSVL